jgi:ERCC4-type nuclease
MKRGTKLPAMNIEPHEVKNMLRDLVNIRHEVDRMIHRVENAMDRYFTPVGQEPQISDDDFKKITSRLPPRECRVLIRLSANSAKKLSALTVQELRGAQGVGPKTALRIENVLHEFGYTLRQGRFQ